MYLRVHDGPSGRLVAACDRTLIGHVFREGGRVLDLDRYRHFYAGAEADAAAVGEALRQFSSVNLVGPEATGVAVRMGLAQPSDLLHIGRVPYLHIYRI